jgi:hypothetical protein
MDAPLDFKTSVLASLDRLGNFRVLGSREALLIGQTKTGAWKRLRLPARYSWFEALMVRAFIKQTGIGRLAILIADDFDHGRPRRLRLECVDPARKQDELLEAPLVAMPGNSIQPGLWSLKSESSGGRLAKLAHAARTEWSGVEPPMRRLLGRPWLLTILVLEMSLQLATDFLRIGRLVGGTYNWLPIIPLSAGDVAYAAYMVLFGAAVVALWRQTRLGYLLALTVTAVQIARPIALVVPVARSMTVDGVAKYLGFSWVFPAAILIMLGLVYMERKRFGALREKTA